MVLYVGMKNNHAYGLWYCAQFRVAQGMKWR